MAGACRRGVVRFQSLEQGVTELRESEEGGAGGGRGAGVATIEKSRASVKLLWRTKAPGKATPRAECGYRHVFFSLSLSFSLSTFRPPLPLTLSSSSTLCVSFLCPCVRVSLCVRNAGWLTRAQLPETG